MDLACQADELAVLRDELAARSARLDAMTDRLEALADTAARLDALKGRIPDTGTLVVMTHPGRFGEGFRLTGPIDRSFSGPAVLGGLPPGTYRVVGDGYRSEPIRVVIGEVSGVRVRAQQLVVE